MTKRLPTSTLKARRRRGLVTNEAMSQLAQSKRAGKYNAKGVHLERATLEVVDKKHPNRIWFASGAEAERYRQLRTLETEGQIRSLRTQRVFPLAWNGVQLGTYRADFEYLVVCPRVHDEYCVVEDVKGLVTDIFDLKKRLVRAQYGVDVVEIPAKKVAQWQAKIPPPPKGG
jgi:Protein of unknown function (DUF1064)